mgnify:FL=1
MKTSTCSTYTLKEEIISSIVHGIGVFLSIAITSVLVTLSAVYGNVWSIVSTAIFGASMMLMYMASTLYHAIPFPHAKTILKKFDHIAIYYLIAGTYTPFLLVLMRGTMGWVLFAVIWSLALLGTVLKIVSSGSGTKIWSVSLYLGMGWLVLIASKTLFAVMSKLALVFLVLGGIFYTVGIIFYLWKSKKYTHAIWHGFVLVGTIMHFMAILFSCVFVG